MAIEQVSTTKDNVIALMKRGEGHFLDFKSRLINAGKLTKILSAFANADGGDVFIGIEDGDAPRLSRWQGFGNVEEANGLIQALEQFFPLGSYFQYEFIACSGLQGVVLHCEVLKTPDVRPASDGKVYARRGAQSLPQDTDDKLQRLRYNKGINSFEDHLINDTPDVISESVHFASFLSGVVPTASPEVWLRKQRLVIDGRPTVAGSILFSDEPQASLPKAGIKIYRYKTSDVATRDTLTGNPTTIEGPAYDLIKQTVDRTAGIVESISLMGPSGLEKVQYPTESMHEIITNAVLHRDYSLNDDIHVRIFDNRVEIQSPGTLPAHVTVNNILEERFARNQRLVRLINKFPDPPNKDVGEGLNTAFEAMKKLKLKDPVIEQLDGSVRVTLKHEKLASPEEQIIEYLRGNEEINNKIARSITFIGSENTIKRVFQKMMEREIIQRISGRSQAKTGYSKGDKFPS